jgi:hypothetical protein
MFDNPWFVGIVGGIVSGVAATWISRLIFSRRDSREYAQKVASVNREVTYSLRPGIAEGNVPTAAVLSALIAATSRKYGVSESDVFSVHQISEELMKEVMDSSFISSITKQEYCNNLLALQEKPNLVDANFTQLGEKAISNSDSDASTVVKERARMLRQMTATTGVMVASLTLVLTIIKERAIGGISAFSDVLLPAIVLITAITVTRQAKRTAAKTNAATAVCDQPTRE